MKRMCENENYWKPVYCVYRLSTHPVISIFLLHGVWVEESDDRAGLRLPVFSMDFTKEQQRHKHFQVVEVIQFPDAEGFALHRGSAWSETPRTPQFPTRLKILRLKVVLDHFNAVIVTS